MNRNGSPDFHAGPGKCFSFIDADNVALGFSQALKHRGISEEEAKFFSLERLLRQIPANRNYLFGAAPDGEETHQWLVLLRAESNFLYRQGRLIEKGRSRKQQGVDVMIAVEALRCAHSKIMESCIIFSDDGDLLPLASALVDLGINTSVFGFGNPKLSRVAQDFQDVCDNYVHIGNYLLARSSVEEGRPSSSGNCNKSMFLGFGEISNFDDGEKSHAVARDDSGGIFICTAALESLDDYNQYYFVYFKSEVAAFARYKLTKNFFN